MQPQRPVYWYSGQFLEPQHFQQADAFNASERASLLQSAQPCFWGVGNLDVDEAALSYAEVKALATGNPAVKEKMALDVDVAKLKLLKANHMNNQYRLEDDIARNFPQQIAKLTEIIASYKADIAHFSEHKITDPEQFSTEISGKVVKRKEVAGKIKEAREQGDLSENAEYDAAKDEQRDIEARIEELEAILKNAEVVVEDEVDLNKINVGCAVKVYDITFDEEMEFKIVGSTEANSLEGKISNESPVGHALIGKKINDVVDVETQAGVIQYKVLDIKRS